MDGFKKIPDYNNYKISNNGLVMNNNGKILKAAIGGHGYLVLCLSKNNISKTVSIHQLMAITFLGHKPKGRIIVVDHINGIKTDNRLENLQIITNRENIGKQKPKTSKYAGVSWDKKLRKWASQITLNGTTKRLGYFESEIRASIAYNFAVFQLNKLKLYYA